MNRRINRIFKAMTFLTFGLILGLSIFLFLGANHSDKITGNVAYTGNSQGANLTLWDNQEGLVAPTNSLFWFYANFSNGSMPITNYGNIWSNKSPETSPLARQSAAFVFDPSTNVFILFGGNNGSVFFNDTWIYNLSLNNWTPRNPDVIPSARSYFSYAYDPNTKSLIVFGGWNSTMDYLSETWIYNFSLNNWTQITPNIFPSRRIDSAMTYDNSSKQFLLFGGYNSTSNYFGETWVYNQSLNNWTNLNPSLSPSPRRGISLAYSEKSKSIILYAGINDTNSMSLTDTWEYNCSLSNWTQLILSSSPGLRENYGLTYDVDSDLFILFGGDIPSAPATYIDSLWVYNRSLNNWLNQNPINSPLSRSDVSFAYDSNAKVSVLFGGSNSTHFFLDTQIYNFSIQQSYCSFSENSLGTWSTPVNMSYDSAIRLNKINKTIALPGTFQFNVTCDGTLFNLGSASVVDDFTTSNCFAPASGDWIINETDVVCKNMLFQINDSINVSLSGNLTIINSTILPNTSNDQIWVTGGKFIFHNSTFNGTSVFRTSSVEVRNSSIGLTYLEQYANVSIINSSVYQLAIYFFNYDENFSISNLVGGNINTFVINSSSVFNVVTSNITRFSIATFTRGNISSSNIIGLNMFNNSNITLYDSTLNYLFLSGFSTAFVKNVSILTYLDVDPSASNSLVLFDRSVVAKVNSFANITLSGNFSISDRSITSFNSSALVNRVYPLFIYNGSQTLNGQVNITNGNQILWQGTLTNSYTLVNLTFNSTTYTNQYNIYSQIGYMGKISLFDSTPINKSQVVSSIPLLVTLNTLNGTLFNNSAYLQITSNKPLVCVYSLNGSSSLNATKTSSYYRIFNGTYFRYGDYLGAIHNQINTTNLPFLLTQNVFSEFLGSNDNDLTFIEEWLFNANQNQGVLTLLGEGAAVYPQNKNATNYLYFENTSLAYNYLLKFNSSIVYNNFSEETAKSDLIGLSLAIQGKTYTLSDLSATNAGNTINNITLSDGSNTIILRGQTSDIIYNNALMAGSFGTLMGSAGRWSGINITYYPNESIYLAENESFLDPAFKKIKIKFASLNKSVSENITFVAFSSTATLNFTNTNNSLISIPFYLNGTQMLKGSSSSARMLAVEDQINFASQGSQVGTLFLFTANNNISRILRVTSFDSTGHTLSLVDDTYGTTYSSLTFINSSANLSRLSLGTLGNLTLNISADQLSFTYVAAPLSFAKTNLGAEITLTQSGAIINENSASQNNVSILFNLSYDLTDGALLNYDISKTISYVSEIFGNSSTKLANTRYGSVIKYDNSTKKYVQISYPQSSVFVEIYLLENSTDVPNAITPSRFAVSNQYGENLLNLICNSSTELVYLSSKVNISYLPQALSYGASTDTTSATITVGSDILAKSSVNYGTTLALGTVITNTTPRTSHLFVLSGLSSGTSFYYNFTLCDIYGRCYTDGPYSFGTVAIPVTPAINLINAIQNTITNTFYFATRRFESIEPGVKQTADLNYGRVPISALEFTTKTKVDKILFRFFNLEKNSTDAPALDEKTLYKYLRFNISYALFEDISDMSVSFRIEKEWFDANKVDKNKITLNRFNGNAWQELETEPLKEDHFYQYYKSKVPGFSVFAITATKGTGTIVIPESEGNSTNTQNPQTNNLPSSQQTQQSQTQQNTQTQSGSQEVAPLEEAPSQVQASLLDSLKIFVSKNLVVVLGGLLAGILVFGGLVYARRPKNMIQELAKRKSRSKDEILAELSAKGVSGQPLEELRQFILASLQQGKKAGEIKATLQSVGWDETIIDDIFALFNIELK